MIIELGPKRRWWDNGALPRIYGPIAMVGCTIYAPCSVPTIHGFSRSVGVVLSVRDRWRLLRPHASPPYLPLMAVSQHASLQAASSGVSTAHRFLWDPIAHLRDMSEYIMNHSLYTRNHNHVDERVPCIRGTTAVHSRLKILWSWNIYHNSVSHTAEAK